MSYRDLDKIRVLATQPKISKANKICFFLQAVIPKSARVVKYSFCCYCLVKFYWIFKKKTWISKVKQLLKYNTNLLPTKITHKRMDACLLKYSHVAFLGHTRPFWFGVINLFKKSKSKRFFREKKLNDIGLRIVNFGSETKVDFWVFASHYWRV